MLLYRQQDPGESIGDNICFLAERRGRCAVSPRGRRVPLSLRVGFPAWYHSYFSPLFPNIFFLILFLVGLGNGVQSRFIENPSVRFMKWFSESGLLEMNDCPRQAAQSTHDTNGTCIWSHLFPTFLEYL